MGKPKITKSILWSFFASLILVHRLTLDIGGRNASLLLRRIRTNTALPITQRTQVFGICYGLQEFFWGEFLILYFFYREGA